MNIEPLKLIFILGGTLLLGSIGVIAAVGLSQRLMLAGLLIGLVVYSGIGAADSRVPFVYIVYFFIFFTATVVGFHMGRVIFLPFSKIIGQKIPKALGSMSGGIAWQVVIVFYILISLVPLVRPEFRLHYLLMPPKPDLHYVFYRQFTEEPNVVLRLIGYIKLLATPFFYLALYRLHSNVCKIFILIIFLMYIDYVANAYIGRGDVLLNFGLLILGIWILRPKYRRWIIMTGIIFMPFFLYALYWYGCIRIGGTIGKVSIGEAIISILTSELSFPIRVGMPIIEAGARVNFSDYLVWIITLPLPKLLTGPIKGARINYEISEFILGLPIGAPGWYVVLPGIVAESFYIFGSKLFWLHGLFLGIIAAFFARVTERVPQFLFFYLYVVGQFTYILNRGGIAALLPTIINEFLLFYLYLFAIVFYRSRKVFSPSANSKTKFVQKG